MSASLPPLDNIRVMVIVWRLRGNIIRTAPCWVCVTQCSQSAAHSCEQFLQVQQIGFVTLGPLRHVLYRGSCLELYYCNMVEWCWWDSSLIWKTNWLPSVLWHGWFGHMTCKNIVPDMTYNVFGGTLNLVQSIHNSRFHCLDW